MKALVIVAHPDDEVIWCGGTIMCHSQWDWTVLCLCRRDDPDRAPRFERACRILEVRGMMSDLDDSPELKTIQGDEISQRIFEMVDALQWDLILTHGSNGEYGHLRHCEIHEVVMQMVASRQLNTQEFWSFAYECDSLTGICHPAAWMDFDVDISPEQLQKKKRMIHDVYGYSPGSIESRACIAPECFSRILINGEPRT